MGVRVEASRYLNRVDHLRTVPAYTRFVSFEPLLAPLGHINLEGIHWAIVGGESGPGARPLEDECVVGIRDHCYGSDVACFFKQWGRTYKKMNGRLLNGKMWNDMPLRMAS
jgi:protein gp37